MEEKLVRDNTEIWIHSLPVDFDKREAPVQYRFMVKLIDDYFEILAGEELKELKHLIGLLVYVYRSDVSNDKIDEAVEKVFEKLSNIPTLKKPLSDIHAEMPPEDQKKMEMCVAKGLN